MHRGRVTLARVETLTHGFVSRGGEVYHALKTELRNEIKDQTEKNQYWKLTLLAIKGRAVPSVLLMIYTVYCTICVSMVVSLGTNISETAELKGLANAIAMIGMSLFLLLAFRTQASYDRWWEGRRIWDAMAGHCNDLGRMAVVWIRDEKLATDILHWTLAFCVAAKSQLLQQEDLSYLKTLLHAEEHRELQGAAAPQTYACVRLTSLIAEANRRSLLCDAHAANMDAQVRGLQNGFGSCDRIRTSPMPFAYVVHLRSFLMLWLLALPFIFVITLHWWSIGVCMIIGYQLLGCEEIAVEIEQPFGDDSSDLPLERIVADIEEDLYLKLSWLSRQQHLPQSSNDNSSASTTAASHSDKLL